MRSIRAALCTGRTFLLPGSPLAVRYTASCRFGTPQSSEGDHDADSMASALSQGLNSSVRHAIRHLPERVVRGSYYRFGKIGLRVFPTSYRLSALGRQLVLLNVQRAECITQHGAAAPFIADRLAREAVRPMALLVVRRCVQESGRRLRLRGRCGQSTRGAGAGAPLKGSSTPPRSD